MSETLGEKTFVDNPFGIVTDKRVVYYRKKGWFGGGSREDVPLKHVTSVRLETARNLLAGSFLIFVGLIFLVAVVGVFPLAMGIVMLWGYPLVVVTTSAGDREAMRGWPWNRQLAEEFASGLRSQLFEA